MKRAASTPLLAPSLDKRCAELGSQIAQCLINTIRFETRRRIPSKFDAARPPVISLAAFAERLFRYGVPWTLYRGEVAMLARAYMEKVHKAVPLDALNVHRVMLACFCLAVKYLLDEPFHMTFMARVCGIGVPELAALEVFLLSLLEFDLALGL